MVLYTKNSQKKDQLKILKLNLDQLLEKFSLAEKYKKDTFNLTKTEERQETAKRYQIQTSVDQELSTI